MYPLYILTLYLGLPVFYVTLYFFPDPCFHYTTNVAAMRLKLPMWSQPFAVGLFDVLLDVPYNIFGISLIWWTWHDTDPNIFDWMYDVPWTRCVYVCVCACARVCVCVCVCVHVCVCVDVCCTCMKCQSCSHYVYMLVLHTLVSPPPIAICST